mgnify:FL=1
MLVYRQEIKHINCFIIPQPEYVTTKNRQFYYKKAYLEISNIFLYGSYAMPLGHIIALLL